MHRITSSIALLLLLVGAADFASADPSKLGDTVSARQIPAELQAATDVVVAGNSTFAIDLYRRLAKEEGNLCFSPFSISVAFAMLHAGARNETEAEMARVLHFPLPQQRLHSLNRELLAGLDRGTASSGSGFSVANRLWGQKGIPFLPAFVSVTRDMYGAEPLPLDFASNPENCRSTINDWVARKTEDRIRNLMPPGSVISTTRLVLANAAYFRGTWATRFDPKITRERPFHVTPASTVTADMMSVSAKFRFGGDDRVRVVELPYSGGDLTMLVLLPNALDGLPALEARLDAALLDTWLTGLTVNDQRVSLPRFEMTEDYSLEAVLATMGMPSVFDPELADLSGIDGSPGLFVRPVLHKAFVKVDEEGTEAAATTTVTVRAPIAPPSFTADHPFLFLIRDTVTGSILFMGRVVDPRQEGTGSTNQE